MPQESRIFVINQTFSPFCQLETLLFSILQAYAVLKGWENLFEFFMGIIENRKEAFSPAFIWSTTTKEFDLAHLFIDQSIGDPFNLLCSRLGLDF